MNLGSFLVLLGIILAALDYLFFHYTKGSGPYRAGILHLAIILIGIGVLCGPNVLIHA